MNKKCLAVGMIWLVLAGKIFRGYRPQPVNIIKEALAEAIVGLPMVYYFLLTIKGIPYINSFDNFFSDHMGLRITNWILLVTLVISADKMAKRISLPSVIRKFTTALWSSTKPNNRRNSTSGIS